MIEVWTWPTPNGHKVHIALEELGLPYKVIPINIGKGDQFKPEFLAITPNHRIPAIVDPDGPGGKPLKLFESAAIMIYLSEKTGGKLIPNDPIGRYKCLEWMMFQMGGVGPMFGQYNHFANYAVQKIPYAIDALYQRGRAAASRAEQAPRRGDMAGRRRIHYGRHHHLPLDPQSRAPEHRSGRVSEREALARYDGRAPGGPARGGRCCRTNSARAQMTDEEREIMFGKTQFAPH